ncbi:hypothetical protein BH18THE2_BH18THE2_14480 [soil metagenome]
MRYCKEKPGLIYLGDKFTQQMPDGSWKCGHCVVEDTQKMKIRTLGINDPESKRIVAEEQRNVEAHNEEVKHSMETFSYSTFRLKRYKFLERLIR